MCEGKYCGDHPFRETGTTTVKVDAEGSIVIAENDTVRNVRRVHTIDSYFICMDIDSATLDTAGSVTRYVYSATGEKLSDDGYMYMLTDTLSTFHVLYSIQTPVISEIPAKEDIVCEDLDGDGLYNWGIGLKPAHCPAWSSDESDGDDSDRGKGHMDEYGYCEILSVNNPVCQYICNDTTLVVPENRSSYLGIMRGVTATIQAKQTFENGKELLLDNVATLVLDGTVINGNSIHPYAGSKIVLNNGAIILKPFEIPLGVELTINRGSIE